LLFSSFLLHNLLHVIICKYSVLDRTQDVTAHFFYFSLLLFLFEFLLERKAQEKKALDQKHSAVFGMEGVGAMLTIYLYFLVCT